jgi:hypothetical protein
LFARNANFIAAMTVGFLTHEASAARVLFARSCAACTLKRGRWLRSRSGAHRGVDLIVAGGTIGDGADGGSIEHNSKTRVLVRSEINLDAEAGLRTSQHDADKRVRGEFRASHEAGKKHNFVRSVIKIDSQHIRTGGRGGNRTDKFYPKFNLSSRVDGKFRTWADGKVADVVLSCGNAIRHNRTDGVRETIEAKRIRNVALDIG